MAVGADPREGPSLRRAAGVDGCRGAPLPPPPLPPLLNAEAVRGGRRGPVRRWVTVLCAGGLVVVVVVSVVIVISLLG